MRTAAPVAIVSVLSGGALVPRTPSRGAMCR